MTCPVSYAVDNGVARISFDRPEDGNPFNLDSARALLDAVLQAKADRARVIVLESAGRFFSVGGDLGVFATADQPEPLLLELAEIAHRATVELVRGDAVVVSAVQGTAAGIGFSLAAAADVIVAADTAKFSLAYTAVGLSPDGGGSLLVHTLGLHGVLRLALLGDLLTAQEAHSAGLVARVVPAVELGGTVDNVVEHLRRGSAAALAATKRLVRQAAEPALETALRDEAVTISRLAGGPDGREGVAAFIEKRRPRFT
ncbi:enoyl-CoA hydratase-related protein [Rhodococcus sp. T2V]|uniref:enoyl-CoA hydratase-related protein n=1 Tax=Rhodococcus sp. T2V TaxID=3034164 RepID=UPI0023E1614F|nr:enoyl-CoA hydratase-related protein [Rhodococcus sp. T2V]MDF3310047.1 enoyl-CoA hydratase-related protein [Rhodococcus sp. T2V]